MSNKSIPNLKPLIYTSLYPKLVEIAKDNGYALAIHGSLSSDFDLVACAWTEDAVEPIKLIRNLAAECSGITNINEYRFGESMKCHRRVAYTIPINAEPTLYLDVSVYW